MGITVLLEGISIGVVCNNNNIIIIILINIDQIIYMDFSSIFVTSFVGSFTYNFWIHPGLISYLWL